MNYQRSIAMITVFLVMSTMVIEVVVANKMLPAFLIGAALAAKKKVIPLPLALPIPFFLKSEEHVPKSVHYPMPVHKVITVPKPYPVYYHGGGGYGGYGDGGHYDDHYGGAAAYGGYGHGGGYDGGYGY